MSADPFATEYTRYDTFRKEKTGALEFAMHKIWRSSALMLDLGSGAHPWPTTDQVKERLDRCIEELQRCRDLLTEKTTDRVGYYDEKEQKMTFINTPPALLKEGKY